MIVFVFEALIEVRSSKSGSRSGVRLEVSSRLWKAASSLEQAGERAEESEVGLNMAVFLINICKFNGCGITFPSLGDLIQHIEDTHIGKYRCQGD